MSAPLTYPALDPEVSILEVTQGSRVLHHRSSNRYFRVSPDAGLLLSLFDGERDYAGIAATYNRAATHPLTDTEILDISQEGLAKFLRFPADSTVAPEPLLPTTPGYLKLSTLILPPAVVGRITKYLYWLYRPAVARSLCALFAVLLLTAFAQYWGALAYHFEATPITQVGLVVVVMFSVTIFHELGHAAACTYYRVRHGGIGIGFYLLTPVMYADVTAAWQLPAAKRIVINLGGMYFELIYSLVLLGLLFVTGNVLFLGFTLMVLVHTLYNLNPFFRTDGYWVLTDATGQSNLRLRSTRLLTRCIVSLARLRSPRYTLSEYALVVYAGVTFAFIGLFLHYILFVYEGSLLGFPGAVVDLVTDLSEGKPMTPAVLADYLQGIMIPVIFFYLLIKMGLLPLFRYLRARTSPPESAAN